MKRTLRSICCGAAVAACPAAASAQLSTEVFGEFVLVEDDAQLLELATLTTITADVYEFQVTNNSTDAIRTFGLGFVGGFLQGPLGLAVDTEFFNLLGQPVADTFFTGRGSGQPIASRVVDTTTELSAVVVSYPNPQSPIAPGETFPVAVFTTPFDAPLLSLSNIVNAQAVVGGQIVDIAASGATDPGTVPDPDPPRTLPTAPSNGLVTGDFVLVQQGLAAADPSTLDPVSIDVYEFQVSNGTSTDIQTFDLNFTGDFLNGVFSTRPDSSLPQAGGTPLLETFFAGNESVAPGVLGLVDDGSTLAAETTITVAGFSGVHVPAGRVAPVAVFSVPAGADPLTFAENFDAFNSLAFLNSVGVPISQTPIPEPASAALLALAGAATVARRRRG